MYLVNVLVGAEPEQKNYNYVGTVGAWNYVRTGDALAWIKAQGIAKDLGTMWDAEARDRLGIDPGTPAAAPAAVAVDATAVAAALAANEGFLAALARAVNDDAAKRLAQ